MQKVTLLMAAGALGALAVLVAGRAEAGVFSGAEGLRIAIDDVSPVMNVHWPRYGYGWRRPYLGYAGWGWRRPYYARWGGWGWRRPYYAGWGGYGWGWRRPIYGAVWGAPIVGVGIGVGGPWGWGGWGWGGPRVGVGFGWGW